MKNVLLVIKFLKCISCVITVGVMLFFSGCICICMDKLSGPMANVPNADDMSRWSVKISSRLYADEEFGSAICKALKNRGVRIVETGADVEISINDTFEKGGYWGLVPGAISFCVLPFSMSYTYRYSISLSAEGVNNEVELGLKETEVSSLTPLAFVPLLWHKDGGVSKNANSRNHNADLRFVEWAAEQIADAICGQLCDTSFYNEVIARKNDRLAEERAKKVRLAEEAARREAERAAEQERKKEQEEAVKREKERKRNEFVSEMRSRHNCSVSTSRLGSVRPTSGTAYPHDGGFYGSFKVFQCVDSGVLVRHDETIYFVETTDTYVDGDELKEGWYKCMGTYQYVTAFGGNKTVFKFCPVSASYGSDIISDIDGQRFAEEFSRALLGF